MSKAKQLDEIPHRRIFHYIKYISIVFLWEKNFGRGTAYSCEVKWRCRISSFYEKRKTKQLKQNFFKTVETLGFCKLQTKICEEISTIRLRHVNYLYSSSIYPHESKNKREKGRKSKVKILAAITS